MKVDLYTPEVRNYVTSRDWPKGLVFEVRQKDLDLPPFAELNFIFFRDNWLTLSPTDHLKVAGILKEVMEKLRADGIPCYMGKIERGRE